MVYLRNQDIMKKKNALHSQYPCIDRLMEEPEAMETAVRNMKSFWNILLYGTNCSTGAVMCIAMSI